MLWIPQALELRCLLIIAACLHLCVVMKAIPFFCALEGNLFICDFNLTKEELGQGKRSVRRGGCVKTDAESIPFVGCACDFPHLFLCR
jgi:hypothetical protein